MTSETKPERDRRRVVAFTVVSDLGPLCTYRDFRERMASLDALPFSREAFHSVRDEVWPDWREEKRAAKQERIKGSVMRDKMTVPECPRRP